jgi:hypothetical protein
MMQRPEGSDTFAGVERAADVVLADPNSPAAWAAYIDQCLMVGMDHWADLGIDYAQADLEDREAILIDKFGVWPLGTRLMLAEAAAGLGRLLKRSPAE